MRDLKFSVTDDVLELGVKILTARISGITNTKSNPDFETIKKERLEGIKLQLGRCPYKDDPVLKGFRDLHTKVGRSNRDYVASSEGLRWLFLNRDRFPHINTVVDIYNLVSLETGLALGAHDIDHVVGNISLRLTTGDETFVPLGKEASEPIFPGEYGYVDDGNNVICRLEVLQVEPTKVTERTTDLFLIVQGNENTEKGYVEKSAKEVCRMIVLCCGGEYSFLND